MWKLCWANQTTTSEQCTQLKAIIWFRRMFLGQIGRFFLRHVVTESFSDQSHFW